MCLTCGRRLCAGCSQNEAVRRRTELALQSVQRQAAEAADSWAAEAAEAARKQESASSELQSAKAQQAAAKIEFSAEQEATLLHKETLTGEVHAERETLDRQIAEAEKQLEERDAAVRQARSRLQDLQAALAAAPRPAADVPDDEAELREAKAEVARFRALASEREQQAAEHQAAAEQAVALESRLRAELEKLRVAHAEKRGKRLANLAFARAELNVERRAAEEAVETELAAAEAEEEARQRRAAAEREERAAAAAVVTDSTSAASDASAAVGGATSTSPVSDAEGDEGVLGRFLGKLGNFIEDLDGLVVPAGGDMAWGLPLEMQMGMAGEYGYMSESMMFNDSTAFSTSGEAGASMQGPMDEEAQTLHMERQAWERKRADCEKQLEWMQRDAERRTSEAEALRAEIARLQAEHAVSRSTADELERELSLEKQRMREYNRKLRNLLLRTVASCRGRILAALRSGSTLKTSELESLFESDWNVPVASGASQENPSEGEEFGRTVSADADLETFSSGLEAMCDELERAALDAGEDARNSGTLSDAMCAFNAAADAKEAAEEWPTSMTPTASSDTAISHEAADHLEGAAAPPSPSNSFTEEDWPEAAEAQLPPETTSSTTANAPPPANVSSSSESDHGITEEQRRKLSDMFMEDWPEASTSFSK